MDFVSLQTRISDAKTFLLENPDERTACAAQIFKIQPITLYSSIATDKKSSFFDMKSSSNKKSSSSAKSARGRQNKILEEPSSKSDSSLYLIVTCTGYSTIAQSCIQCNCQFKTRAKS